MELLLRGVMVALIGATLAVANIDLEVKIAEQLQHFSDYRFPDAKHKDSWLKAREYIKEQFESYGLAVQTQTFSTTIETSTGDTAVEGTNIIGVARATSDKPGAVLVVGADYDTNTRKEPGPLFNNGAGVASLLETSRLFMHSVFRLEHTTVFVAFDLNTKEHDSGPGKPGGWYFVNEWLWEYMNQSDTHFGGAFVLDSLMNVNQDKSTQVASEEFHLMFPETYSRIVESNFKGNFLSLVTFPEKKSIDLKEQFSGNYNKLRMRNPFRLEDMTLPNKTTMSELLSELTTQDTIHFWSFTNNGTATPLPAVLVTDTETLRQNPAPCGSHMSNRELADGRPGRFSHSTVKALTSTLLKRQASRLTGG
ncbi:uncharacterized protein LOC122248255 [Penaeus japonicus]|uniref:uncharacterized protein LOC122248255 n=1 Tax=Penaeus japonicus TaxID=27405 RepID=UPI001C7163AF|nr:uncharacterized protein LOC122248255 [Penaeus japonicus]